MPGDPPSPAGLLGDQGILKEGLGDEGAFWGLRVVVITNQFRSNNQQQWLINLLCGEEGSSGNQGPNNWRPNA